MRGETKTDEYEVSHVVGDFQGLDSDRPLCQGGLACVLSCTSIMSAVALTIMESSSTRNKSYKLRYDSNLFFEMLFVQTIMKNRRQNARSCHKNRPRRQPKVGTTKEPGQGGNDKWLTNRQIYLYLDSVSFYRTASFLLVSVVRHLN